MKLISRPFLILFIVLHTMVSYSQSSQDQLIQALGEEGLTGAVWSIIDKEEIQLGAWGSANASTGQAMSTENRVHIGSVTKTLIATGILRMATKGELPLETLVRDILPEIEFINPWRESNPVTVRHLLDHTSGLEDARLWQIFSLKPAPQNDLMEVFSRDPDVLKLRTIPGSQFSYSNMGYTMLGLIIERISGKPYEEYLDNELLKPIGMTRSTFHFVDHEADPSLAMGHFEEGQTQEAVPSYLRPAMQFTTTAHDMGRLAQFLMSDGYVDGQPFIHSSLLQQMGHVRSTDAAKNGLQLGYALGLSYRDRYDVLGYYHSGNTVGYRATLYLFPQDQKAFFISFNADSETANYRRFNKIMIDGMNLKKPTQSKEKQASKNDLTNWTGYYALNPRFEMFSYLDYLFGFVKLNFKDSQLAFTPFQSEPLMLGWEGKGLYKVKGRNKPSHVLYEQNESKFVSNGLSTYVKTSGLWILLNWISLIAGLSGLLYILVKCLISLFDGNFRSRHPMFLPGISIISLLIPIPFFVNQFFLALGDLTMASISLSIVTGLLPVSLTIGLLKTAFGKVNPTQLDIAAQLFAWQWMIVLFAWDMIPFMLWS